jgi:hypothetical protein
LFNLGFVNPCVKPDIPCIARAFKWLTITLLDFSLVKKYLVTLFITLLSLKLTLRCYLKPLNTHGISGLIDGKTKNHIVSYLNPEILNG